MRPIVVVGSINMDLVFNTSKIPAAGETIPASCFEMYPGGKGANQAVAAARLGYPVQLIGKLGSDIFGKQLRSHLESAHVGLTGVTLIDEASGTAAIIVTEDGENSIIVNSGANLAVSPEYLESQSSLLCNAAIVLTQLEIPVDTVECLSVICARNHVPLILDPAPARDLPRRVLQRVRWFTPNETEAAFYDRAQMNPAVTNDLSGLAKRLRQLGPTGVLLKSGARGVYVSSEELEERIPAPAVKVVDTTAAGDTFNGAFAVALMRDKPLAESIRFAVAAASVSVTRAGAQPSMPTLEEVQETILAQR